jgi:hypothetical protein
MTPGRGRERGEVLRRFNAAEDTAPVAPATPEARPKRPLCPVTGKECYPGEEYVPAELGGRAMTPYWCAYCSAWHCSHRTKQEARLVRRRMGKGKLYPDPHLGGW